MFASHLIGAYRTPIRGYISPSKEQYPEVAQSAYGFLLLAVNEKKNGAKEPFHGKLMQHLRHLIKGGNEPCCDAVQVWAYPATVCALAVCRHTQTVWGELEDEEISRADLLMKAFALMSNFISNDANTYKTGIGLLGDVDKNRVANFRFPLIVPAVAAAHYFGGADALDAVLAGFDYDAFIAQAGSYGFGNIISRWTTQGFTHGEKTYPGAKELLTTEGYAYIRSNTYGDIGNIYRGGYGRGATLPYIYEGHRADDTAIIESLVEHNHSGGACASHTEEQLNNVYIGYTVDGSVSEAEGLEGMMREYHMPDPAGLRSSGHYCSVDFSMQTALLVMAKVLGVFDIKSSELWSKVSAGVTDHFNKMRAGYIGQGMGKKHIEYENNFRGYIFAKALWEEFIEGDEA